MNTSPNNNDLMINPNNQWQYLSTTVKASRAPARCSPVLHLPAGVHS